MRKILLAGVSVAALALASGQAFAQDEARATVNFDETTVTGNTSDDYDSVRTNLISGSYNPFSGILHLQENNGSNNAINAASAVVANAAGPAVPISTVAIVNSNTNNNDTNIFDTPERSNEILNSFNGFDGQSIIQQNNGDHNEIGAATAVYGSAVDVLAVDQDALANSDTFSQEGNGPSDSVLDTAGSSRINLIDPSFTNAMGTIVVQQNNGTANAMSVASSIVGVAGNTASINQDDVDAQASVDDQEVYDQGSTRSNQILNSFNGAMGEIEVQQNNGDVNSMSIATAVAGVTGNVVGSVDQDVEADDNDVTNIDAVDNGSMRTNTIDPSFTNAEGLISVQQNNGNANAMAIANAVAAVDGNVTNDLDVDEAEADDNDIIDVDVVTAASVNRANNILNSFQGASGQISVQQNNGDANTLNIANGVVAVLGNVGDDIDVDSDGDDNDIATVDAEDAGSTRANTINPSFTNASGLIAVQQNNGNANSVNIANTVAAVTGDVGGDIDHEDSEADEFDVGVNGAVDVDDDGANRTNTITDSFGTASGQISVQQNNGDANVLGISNAVTVVGGNVAGDIDQEDTDAELNTIDNLDADADFDIRRNDIANSFNNVNGTTSVQQNNGNGNIVAAANSLSMVTGNVGGDLDQDDLEAANSEILSDVEIDSEGSDRDNLINPSFNGFQGIASVQQNNGDGNVLQTSSTLAAITGTVNNIDQEVDAGDVDDAPNLVSGVNVDSADDDATFYDNAIDSSFNGATGHAAVQQNNGSANILSAAQAVAAGMEGAEDITQDVDVYGVAEDSNLTDDGSTRNNSITGSFANSFGTYSVQQNNGDGNVMGIATAHVATLNNTAAGFNVDDTDQSVNVAGRVEDQDFSDDDDTTAEGARSNLISAGSFNGSSGVHNVQQNNGSGNVIGIGLGVVVDQASGGSGADENVDSQVVTTFAEVFDNDADIDGSNFGNPERVNTISDSFNNFSGVGTVQQNNGDNNVIGAAVAVRANVGAADDIDMVSGATADATAVVEDNEMNTGNPANEGNVTSNTINPSFNGAQGVVTVQQNNGNNNGIGAATGVVANSASAVLLPTQTVSSTATAFGTVDNNDVELGPDTDLDNLIENSFNGGAQIVGTVQQNNGHSNAIGASTQVSADDGSLFGPAVSVAALGSFVANNTTTIEPGVNTFDNTLTNSFNGASGVVTVQQNNGSNNAIGSAISVVANF